MDDQYHAIFKENVRELFDDYTTSLKMPEIDYFAIGIQNTINRESASVMSRLEWQKTFKALNFAPYDPLRKAALQTHRSIIFIDELDCLDSLGKEIMRQRKLYEIDKGIVVMDRHLTYNYMLTLGTHYSKFDSQAFYLKYYAQIKHIFEDLKMVLEPIAADFRVHDVKR